MRNASILLATGALVAGCGGTGDEAAVRAVFERLDGIQQRGDAEAACEQVFLVAEAGREESEAEREREGRGEAGESPEACRTAFATAASTRRAQVRDLRTTVQSVRVEGDEAAATLRSRVTRADGTTFTNVYTRDLVRHDGSWRIRISPEG